MKHGIDYKKAHCKVGDIVPVYPSPWRREPFIGVVSKVKKNKYGRINYYIDGMLISAEELCPDSNQKKLKIKLKLEDK